MTPPTLCHYPELGGRDLRMCLPPARPPRLDRPRPRAIIVATPAHSDQEPATSRRFEFRRRALASSAYRWYALLVATLSQASVSSVVFAVGPLAPLLLADFKVSRAEIGLTTTAMYVSSSVMALVGGRAADRVGERRMLALSGLIVGLAALLATRSGSFWAFLGANFVIGIGSGIQNPAGSAAVMRWFKRDLRGLAMGLRQTGVPLGSLVAAIAWPIAAVHFGWRASYLVAGLFMLSTVSLVVALYYDPPSRGASGLPGRRPYMELVRDRRLLRLGVIFLTQLTAQQAAATYLVLFLTESFGAPVPLAAAVLGAVNFVAMAARIGWGALSDRVFQGRRTPVLWIIVALSVLGTLHAALLPAHVIPLLVSLALLLGLSIFAWTGIIGALVVETAGTSSSGSAVALVMAISAPGSLLGPPLFGFIADHQGYRGAWLVMAAIVACGALALRGVRETPAGESRPEEVVIVVPRA